MACCEVPYNINGVYNSLKVRSTKSFRLRCFFILKKESYFIILWYLFVYYRTLMCLLPFIILRGYYDLNR